MRNQNPRVLKGSIDEITCFSNSALVLYKKLQHDNYLHYIDQHQLVN